MKTYLILLVIFISMLMSCSPETTNNGDIRGQFNIPIPESVLIKEIDSVVAVITYDETSTRERILQKDMDIENVSALDQRIVVFFTFPESAETQLQYSFFLNNGTVAEGTFLIGDTASIPVPEILDGSSGVFIDLRDSLEYGWIEIGEQRWMAKNLNFETDSNSYCYNDSSANCDMYGRLYTWDAAMDGFLSSESNPSGVQGVCPMNWHLPSDEEWTVLSDHVIENSAETSTDDIAAYLKATSGWVNNGKGTDYFGFTALPGGYRNSDGSFNGAGIYGYWWSATENGSSNAQFRNLFYFNDIFTSNSDSKTKGFSVRCIRDTP